MHSKPRPPTGLDALWGMANPPQRGPAPRLSVDDIARAAVALADAEGLAACTLGAVAKQVGLTTTALYRYVENKDVLVDLMADRALGDPPAMDGLSWREAAATWARRLRQAYARHPWLIAVPASGPPRRPGPYGWMAPLVGRLDGAIQRPAAVALMLDCLVRGYAGILETTAPEPWLGEAVSARFPTLAPTLSDDWANPEEEFEDALAALLRGLA